MDEKDMSWDPIRITHLCDSNDSTPYEPQGRKRTFGHVRPAKIQIRLRIRAVWSESSLGACRMAKDAVSSYGQRRLWSDCADA